MIIEKDIYRTADPKNVIRLANWLKLNVNDMKINKIIDLIYRRYPRRKD